MKRFYFLAVLFSLTLLGCSSSAPPPKGTTKDEVRDKYRERFAELVRHFAGIAGKLPPAGSVKKVSAPVTLDPSPVFIKDESLRASRAEYKTAVNTGLLSVEELSNIESKLDLSLGPHTYVNYPRANFRQLKKEKETYSPEDRDGTFARDFETGLALRYLIVYRVTKLERPKITFGEKAGFIPGSVDMDVFLVDLKSGEVAVSFPISVKTPKEVKIPVSRGSKEDYDPEDPIVRVLEGQAFSQIFENLAATTQGKFENFPR